MRALTWLLLCGVLVACKSDADKAREREQRMIEEAKADAAAEAEFIRDSLALDSTITVDSIRSLRTRTVTATDDDGDAYTTSRYEAVGTRGDVCALTLQRYAQLVQGDTLRCQWGPPE